MYVYMYIYIYIYIDIFVHSSKGNEPDSLHWALTLTVDRLLRKLQSEIEKYRGLNTYLCYFGDFKMIVQYTPKTPFSSSFPLQGLGC